MKDFQNKVIWITGASSGIGEALAYLLARNGTKLILSATHEEKLLKVKGNCEHLNCPSCMILPLDLSNMSNAGELTTKVIKKFGRIDMLVNNGGISQRAMALETPLEIDRKIMEIDYFGGIALTKSVLPYMLEQGEGYIAVTSSISGRFGFPLRSAYAAAKFAIYGFYETLRAELAAKNITVTIICPGRVRTNISFHALDKNGKPHGVMDPGQDTGISPEKAALQILKAFRKNKREVLVGGKELLMVYIKRFFPGLHSKIVQRIKPE